MLRCPRQRRPLLSEPRQVLGPSQPCASLAAEPAEGDAERDGDGESLLAALLLAAPGKQRSHHECFGEVPRTVPMAGSTAKRVCGRRPKRHTQPAANHASGGSSKLYTPMTWQQKERSFLTYLLSGGGAAATASASADTAASKTRKRASSARKALVRGAGGRAACAAGAPEADEACASTLAATNGCTPRPASWM